jgi:hypothetical protein
MASLFDGQTLAGWHAVPRLPGAPRPGGNGAGARSDAIRSAEEHPAKWSVVDGAIVGEQDPPGSGYGGYLLTDATYADFVLHIDAKPDWPADTGVLVRTTARGSQGFQILLDHRRSGGIGGFYGNGIGNFRAMPYTFDAERDADGTPIRLIADDPRTSIRPAGSGVPLSYAAPIEEFLNVWKWGDWNTFTIRCTGKYPLLTTWVNGLKVCELDTAAIQSPSYDKDRVAELLGRAGHIALEVHNNDPTLGKERWWPGAKCRWTNIHVELLTGS